MRVDFGHIFQCGHTSRLKSARTFVLAFSLSSLAVASLAQVPSIQPNGTAPPETELQRRFDALLDARKSADPVAISRSSGRVLALGLAQMAKLRLDTKEYAEALELCKQSLEFEDSAQTHLEMALLSLYQNKTADAVLQANTAATMDPGNSLAWTVKGEALLQDKDYEGAVSALVHSRNLKSDAETFFSLGMAYLGLGDKQKASDAFSQVKTLTKNATWSRILIGRGYERQKFPQEAIDEFKAALELDPRIPGAHYYWARALLSQNDWSPTPEVRSQLREELKLNPRHMLANYLLGIFESLERNYRESDGYLRVAAELNPKLPETWTYLGLNANARDDKPSAEKYFRKAITLRERAANPDEHLSVRKAYIALGRILLASGRKQEGEQLLKKAREMQVQDLTERQEKMATIKSKEGIGVPGAVGQEVSATESQNPLTFARSNSADGTGGSVSIGRSSKATIAEPLREGEARLRKILGFAFNDLATAEALQEKFDLSLQHYLAAEKWDAGIPGLKRNLALAYFYSGRPAEATPILEKIILQRPEDIQARTLLAEAYFSAKEFDKCARVLTSVSGEASKDPRLAFVLAKSLAETGRRQEALRILKALEVSDTSSSAELLLDRAHLWKELGDSERATQCLRRVLLLDPGNNDANCALHLPACVAFQQAQ